MKKIFLIIFCIVLSSCSVAESIDEKINENVSQSENKIDETNDNSIRPEVKDSIDSFESFMNEYCVFMEKFNSSDGLDADLLSEYQKFANDYSETKEKMELLKGDLNDKETLYYAEVLLRVEKMIRDIDKK